MKKLKRAGADTVISPAVLGARFLAESALGGGAGVAEQELLESDVSEATADAVDPGDGAADAVGGGGDTPTTPGERRSGAGDSFE